MARDKVEVEVLTHTDKSNKSLGSYLGSLAKVTAALYAFKRLVVDNVKAGLEYAGSIDELSASFTVLLRDGRRATALMDELKTFAATTPFQMEQLAQATKVLINTGTDVDQVTDVLRDLGNAAMGNAEIMDRLTDAYSKLQTKGKASLEELNRFLEAGVPILDELQKSLGVTRAELMDMISKGKVHFEDVNTALQNLTRGEGKLAGLIEVQSRTLPGLLSTLRDVVDQIRGGVMEGFLPGIKAGLAKVIEWLQGVAVNVKNWADKNAPVIYSIFTNLPAIARTAWDTAKKLMQAVFNGPVAEETMAIFAEMVAFALRSGFGVIGAIFQAVIDTGGDLWEAYGEEIWDNILKGFKKDVNNAPDWIQRLLGVETGSVLDMYTYKPPSASRMFAANLETRLKATTENIKADYRDLAGDITAYTDTVKSELGTIAQTGLNQINFIIATGKAGFEEWVPTMQAFEEEADNVSTAVQNVAYNMDEHNKRLLAAVIAAGLMDDEVEESAKLWGGYDNALQWAIDTNYVFSDSAKEVANRLYSVNLELTGLIKALEDMQSLGTQSLGVKYDASGNKLFGKSLNVINGDQIKRMIEIKAEMESFGAGYASMIDEVTGVTVGAIDQVQSLTEAIKDMAIATLQSGMVDAFYAVGVAIAENESAIVAFGEAMKGVVSDVLTALAKELAVRSVAAFLTGNVIAGAGYAGAAALAATSAGVVSAMAEGGIVTKPTVALIGEAGPEAVVPLGRSGVTGDTYYVSGNVFVDDEFDRRVIRAQRYAGRGY